MTILNLPKATVLETRQSYPYRVGYKFDGMQYEFEIWAANKREALMKAAAIQHGNLTVTEGEIK